MALSFDTSGVPGPHRNAPIFSLGPEPGAAPGVAPGMGAVVAIMLHGRGGAAQDILGLHGAMDLPGLSAIAPQAAGGTWYPQSFLAPGTVNQAGIESAHALIEALIGQLAGLGVGSERVALMGFSQGACLALTHAARFPRRYALVAAFTGGLIGPPGTAFEFEGDLSGTPVFLGANDPDPHVPWARVSESASVLERLGAAVTLVRYPGEPHAVNRDEIERVRGLLGG